MDGIDFENVISAAELVRRDWRPHGWVLQQMVPRGGITLLAGETASGKSLLGLDLALGISSGRGRAWNIDLGLPPTKVRASLGRRSVQRSERERSWIPPQRGRETDEGLSTFLRAMGNASERSEIELGLPRGEAGEQSETDERLFNPAPTPQAPAERSEIKLGLPPTKARASLGGSWIPPQRGRETDEGPSCFLHAVGEADECGETTPGLPQVVDGSSTVFRTIY